MNDVARRLGIVASVIAGATACNALLGIVDVPLPAGADGGADGGADAAAPADAHETSTLTPALEASADAPSDAGPSTSDGGGVCGVPDDARNCGTCGHDCLGGRCTMGACQPVVVYPGDGGVPVQPSDLRQDDAFLYWTDMLNDTVRRTSKATGATVDLLPADASAPFVDTLAVDDAGLYWGDLNGVWRCPKGGCPGAPTLVASSGSGSTVYSLAIDDVGVYWSEGSPQIFSAHKYAFGRVGSVIWQGAVKATHVTTDGQRVYFTGEDGVLRGVTVDGDAGFSVGTAAPAGSHLGGAITLSGGAVYWTIEDPSQGEVLGMSTASLSPNPIAVQQQFPLAVATDGTNVYWAVFNNSGASKVMGCAIASCTPAALADGALVRAIVVDNDAIYWTDSQAFGNSNGAIYKLAK